MKKTTMKSKSPIVAKVTATDERIQVLWGNHSKITARTSDRPTIQAFYREVLGCEVGIGPQHVGGPSDTDRIRFPNDFIIGVHYDDSALSDADQKKAIWLELKTTNPDDLKRRVQEFGIQGFDYFDKDHFYFQAPGGQVFRIAD